MINSALPVRDVDVIPQELGRHVRGKASEVMAAASECLFAWLDIIS